MKRPPTRDDESAAGSDAGPPQPAPPLEVDETFTTDAPGDAAAPLLLVRSDESPGPAAGVLLVEDDLELLELGRRILASEFPVATAASAAEALMRVDDARIGVMITDLHMPGASGLDLVREMAIRRPDVICIIMSGTEDLDAAVHEHRRHIHRTLRKPVRAADLREAVAHAADVWVLRRRNAELAAENLCLHHALAGGADANRPDDVAEPLRRAVAAYERQRIADTLVALRGNKSAAARKLGLTYRGLLLKMQRYGMIPSRPGHDR